ncbi:HIT family protein [archaeon CG07_land_8_20_14_0_80_38_8]|nr:MAG: HIT family protein [archaeon CG07_land_8_20_14_0_80_38_8]PIU88470.1 MAG: HIT family protein [archaeon CG06_land_8_20_14_3_00_37_11]
MSDNNCVFCLIGSNRIQSAKIYEDDDVVAFLDIRPASEGHVQVISKQHAPLISMLDVNVRNKIFNTALNIGSGMVSKLGAAGVSYLINEGAGAGQRVPHAGIQVIPRYEGDNVNINLNEKEYNQEEINTYLQSVIKKLQSSIPEKKEKIIEKKPEPEKPEQEEVVVEERVPKYW